MSAQPDLCPPTPSSPAAIAPVWRCLRCLTRRLAACFRHDGPVWQIAWAHPQYGNILASCSYDRTVMVWKEHTPQNWAQIYVYREHEGSGQLSTRKMRFLNHWAASISESISLRRLSPKRSFNMLLKHSSLNTDRNSAPDTSYHREQPPWDHLTPRPYPMPMPSLPRATSLYMLAGRAATSNRRRIS